MAALGLSTTEVERLAALEATAKDIEQLTAELAKTKARLAKLEEAARDVCNACNDFSYLSKTEAVKRLGDLINYPGYYELVA